MAVDPVCGAQVPEAGGFEATVRGRSFRFCSKACLRLLTQPGRELAAMRRGAVVALAAGAAVSLVALVGGRPDPMMGVLMLLAGASALAVAGPVSFEGLARAVATRTPTVEALAAAAAAGAWVCGAAAVLAPQAMAPASPGAFLGPGALLLGALLAARLLTQGGHVRTREEVLALLELEPETARVERDGREVEVPAQEVAGGDIVVVRPGERIPVDGVVVGGESAVDERLLTGEAIPADKGLGDVVMGGTANLAAPLRVQATRVGGTTALARIVGSVEAARRDAPHRRTERASTRLAALVAGAAALTLLGWLLASQPLGAALGAALAVVLLGLPAAVALTTPAAHRTGAASAAERGILLKDPAALAQLGRADLVVLDKTGTLTRGDPVVTDIHALDGDADALLAQVASAESGSPHPLGKALVRAARERGLEVAEPRRAQVYAGVGVEAAVNGSQVLVGSATLLHDRRIDPRPTRFLAERLQAEGKTVVLVARGRKAVGVLGLADALRPEAAEAVKALQALGTEVALVTGDASPAAKAVADKLGVRRIFASITPTGKAGLVRGLREGGKVVVMVGDGVNDAPALAAADAGVAMGLAAAAAADAADVVLLRDDLRGLAAAVELGRRSTQTARRDARWAFAASALLLPLAAVGLLAPLVAGVAMALGTLAVVANAARRAEGAPHETYFSQPPMGSGPGGASP